MEETFVNFSLEVGVSLRNFWIFLTLLECNVSSVIERRLRRNFYTFKEFPEATGGTDWKHNLLLN